MEATVKALTSFCYQTNLWRYSKRVKSELILYKLENINNCFIFLFSIVLYMDNIATWIAAVISVVLGLTVALLVQLFLVPWQRSKVLGKYLRKCSKHVMLCYLCTRRHIGTNEKCIIIGYKWTIHYLNNKLFQYLKCNLNNWSFS